MAEHEDYASNAKSKKEQPEQKPKEPVQKVIDGEAIVRKRGLGRKFKDLFVQADVKGTARYIVSDVLIPAAQNMVVDAVTRGIQRIAYGEKYAAQRGTGTSYSYGPKTIYNRPSEASGRGIPPRTGALMSGSRRQIADDIIIPSQMEAQRVLDLMNEMVDRYGYVTLGDYKSMCEVPSPHTDQLWGWVVLGGVEIVKIREGWVLDLPPAEPLR